MVSVATSYNNFSRGKIDHDMMGRFDLPIYQTGADIFRNFVSNFKGNAIYSAGFEQMLEFQDCALAEFKFQNNQNYLLVFYANKIRFLSYDGNGDFGWVLDGGLAILEVATPYTLAEAKTICNKKQYSQNADVMVVTHNNHEPRKLIRTSANSFTFNTYSRLNDPFGLTYAATKNITAITQAQFAQATIAAHGYTVGQSIKLAGIVGMTQLNGYTARVASVVDANNITINVDTRTFTAYGSAGTAALLLTGDYPACVLFYKARLYYAATPLKITTIFASTTGLYDDFTQTPVNDTSALIFTLADISQKIEWLYGGDNSLIAGSADGVVAVNGGGVGTAIKAETVEANKTSAEGTNSTYPLSKDGLIFYVNQASRNMLYFSYDLLTESFSAEDANFISYDITRGGIGKIRYKKDRNDLIFCVRDGDLISLNFKQKENVIGWHERTTMGVFQDIGVISDNTGKQQLFALTLRNGAYFIERQGEYVEFAVETDFFTNDETADRMAYIRYVSEQLKSCLYLDNSQAVSNLQTTQITFDGNDQIEAAGAVFNAGHIGREISYKTLTGYESGRFLITGYTDTTHVTVDVVQAPTTNIYSDWYLTFSSISGLSQYSGQTIGVVTDGGYFTDFLVSGGIIDLGKQVTHAVIGYKYKGVIKSFCLGFQIQAENTQVTTKAIYEAHMRCVASAGGKFGSSLYALEAVQELGQFDLNYLPPIVIDGTKAVVYTDDFEKDKFFYVVQDEPLPLTVAAVVLNATYSREK